MPGDIALGQPLLTTTEEQQEDNSVDSYAAQFKQRMHATWNVAHKEIEKSQAAQKIQYDKKSNTAAEKLSVGDLVFVHTPHANKAGITRKLQHLYKGPQRIIKIDETNATVRMAHQPRGKLQKVHLNRCKRANRQCPEDPEGDASANMIPEDMGQLQPIPEEADAPGTSDNL